MTAPVAASSMEAGHDLVRRHQAGDPDAFAEIYRTHYNMILKFALYRVKKQVLAEDLTQDTFTRAFARLGSFEIRDRAIGAWLITICRNLIVDYYKRPANHWYRPMSDLPEYRVNYVNQGHESAAEDVLAVQAGQPGPADGLAGPHRRAADRADPALLQRPVGGRGKPADGPERGRGQGSHLPGAAEPGPAHGPGGLAMSRRSTGRPTPSRGARVERRKQQHTPARPARSRMVIPPAIRDLADRLITPARRKS